MDYEKRLVDTLIYLNERIDRLDFHLATTPNHRELLGLRAQLVKIKLVIQGESVASDGPAIVGGANTRMTCDH